MKLLSTAAVWPFAGLFIIPNWIHAQSPLGLGDRNSSTPSQISAAKSEASPEHSFRYDDASLCQADSDPASQTAPPRPAARGVGIGKVGIGVSATTLGIGSQVAVSIAPTLNLRSGALIYNGNNLRGAASVPPGQQFSLGSHNFCGSSTDPITETGKLTFRTAAPELRVGWGNLVPRWHHFSVSFYPGGEAVQGY